MIGIIIAAIVGAGLGAGGFFGYQRSRQINGKNQIEKDLANAKTKAGDIVLKAKDEALKIENERRREWQKTENRLADREKTLDNKLEELDRRSEKLWCNFTIFQNFTGVITLRTAHVFTETS